MLGLHPGDHALVLPPHPDDETLGPGGTIAALSQHGVIVDVLAIACRAMPMYGGDSDPHARTREFDAACTVLGVRNRVIAWIDTAAAHDPPAHVHELITLIERGPGPSLATTRPALMLVPSAESHHQDHLAVHHAAIAALRPGHREDRPLPRIVAGYDGPEDQAWRAHGADRPLLIDTTSVADIKVKAVHCYPSQLRPSPHPRNADAIAALDAATGVVAGTTTAEKFALYRVVS